MDDSVERYIVMGEPRRIPQLRDEGSHYLGILAALESATPTRRSLLLGLGGSAALLPLVGHAARAAANFSVRQDEYSVELTVAGASAWRLDTRWFDGNPQLRVTSTQDLLRVELRNAFFPGTDVPALLRLDARRRAAEWDGELRLPALSFSARMRFAPWLLGLEPATGAFALTRVGLRAAPEVSLEGLEGQLKFMPDWVLSASKVECGEMGVSGRSVRLTSWRLALPDATSVDPVTSRRTWLWCEVEGGQGFAFGDERPDLELHGVGSGFIDASQEQAHLTFIADGERVGALRWRAIGCLEVPVQSARVTRAFGTQANSCIAEVTPTADRWVRFEGGAVRWFGSPYLRILLASTAPTEVSIDTGTPAADRFVVALQGSDQAVFERRGKSDASAELYELANLLHFTKYDVPLDAYDLVLRRAVDGLFCRVRFRNVRLRQGLQGWYLAAVKPVWDSDHPLLEFDFGTQHLREEAVYFTEWCQDDGPSQPDDLPVPDEVAALLLIKKFKDSEGNPGSYPPKDYPKLPPPDLIKPLEQFIAALKSTGQGDYEAFRVSAEAKGSNAGASPTCKSGESVVRHEAAGASHLLFRMSPGDTLSLEMNALFGWASAATRKLVKLEPVFSRRAAAPGTLTLLDETLDREVTDPASLAQPKPALTDPGYKHHEFATRIEAPTHLVVSPIPNKNGNVPSWTASGLADGTTADISAQSELWSARMSSVQLRALFSCRMSFEDKTRTTWGGRANVFSPPRPYNSADPGEKDFRAAYDSRDLHELVCLTSVYNFPALCGSKQVQGCGNRDQGPWVNPADDQPRIYPPGRFLPVPMRADLLMLTSQGATFRYRGTWSPPASNESKGALTLKRYDHDGHLGRDSHARMEYKGFLFPLGHPATLIKETERRICLEPGSNRKRKLVARHVQRFFIHVPAFKRSFKAVGQPHDRLWGHAETSIRSFTTPDLAKPESSPVAGLGRAAFWPRLRGSDPTNPDDDVLFEFEDSLTSTTYSAPLIFVDGNVAHSVDAMKAVVDYWRAEVRNCKTRDASSWKSTPERFFATVTNGKLAYLPGERSENTDIETTRILLGVAVPMDEGYQDAPASKESLRVTPRMEAEDQPPFYPVRRRALIASTQLSVLTGNRAKRFLMEFDPVFLKYGIESTSNAAKIFGVFVDAKNVPHMSFDDDTSRSGGFASPSAKIVWYSKSRGPIGGPADKIVPLGEATASSLALSARAQSDGQGSHADDFDPKEYFGQVLGNAKLLGVVRLVDVLEVLLLATGTEVPTIKRQDLYDLALPALGSALEFIREQLRRPTEWFRPGYFPPGEPQAFAADRLRPDWERLISAVNAVDKLVHSASPDPTAILAAANDIGAACDRFSASVRAIANDPVVLLPDALKKFVEQARSTLDALKQLMPPPALLRATQLLARTAAELALRERLRTLIADVTATPAYSRLRAALVRVADRLDELEAAKDDAQKALEAFRSNLFAEIRVGIQYLSEQLTCFDQLAIGACTAFSDQVKKEVLAQAEFARSQAEPLAKKCAAVLEVAEREINVAETTQLAPQGSIVAARQGLLLLSQALNSEADALAGLKKHYSKIVGWPGPCADTSSEFLHSLGRDAIEYVLLAPERALRCVSAFEQIGKGLQGKYGAIAKLWLLNLQPDGSLYRCSNALLALAQAASIPVLRQRLTEAAQAADALRQKYKSLSELADNDLQVEIAAAISIGSPLADATRSALEAAQDILAALQVLSPQLGEAAIRAAVHQRLGAVRSELEMRLAKEVTDQSVAVGMAVCDYLKRSALEALLTELVDVDGHGQPAFSYLSVELRTSAVQLRDAIRVCAPGDFPMLLASAAHVWDLLSHAASSGNAGELVEIEQIMRDIVAQLGVPTRVRISYDWATTVTETPKGNSAIFEPLRDRKLTISAVIEASVKGGRPSVSLDASLAPFAIHLFGKTGASNFLSIHFDELRLSARPGQALDCKTDVTLVKPGEALGFVNRLSSLFGGRSGFYLLPSVRGIEVGYRYSKPRDLLGGFVVQNIDFSISASLPFDNSPVRTTLKLAEKERPFLISAGIYGGGGFLGVRTRADTLELLEASFEYGAVSAFGFGPVTGSGRITAGIYIRMGGRNPLIEGFFCAVGEASVADLISISAVLRVGLKYQIETGQTAGDAEYQFKFSLGIFDYSYSATVAYAKSGDGAKGGQAALPADEKVMLAALGDTEGGILSDGPSKYAGLLSSLATSSPKSPERHAGLLQSGAWNRYWAAFSPRPRPLPHEWITQCRPAALTSNADVDDSYFSEKTCTGLERVVWYIVPWGKNGTKLRAGLRAMPIVFAKDSSARTEWPRLLANTSTVEVALYKLTPSGYEQTGTKNINVGERYRARLAEWGLTVSDAQRLWAAVFPADLEMPAADVRRYQGDQIALHRTDAIVNSAARTAGMLFADAMGCFDNEAEVATRNFIVPAIASSELRELLQDLAGMYVPITGRAASDGGLKRNTSDIGGARSVDPNYRDWVLENVLEIPPMQKDSGGGGPSYSFSTVPYSQAAINIILRRGATLNESDRARLPSKELASEFLLRQTAYKPSAPSAKRSAKSHTDDFHRRLGGIASHPWLMKVLGLVIDIEVEDAAQSAAVCVQRWGCGVLPTRRMRTIMKDGYSQRKQDSAANPSLNSTEHSAGLLDVSARAGNFSLTQLDPDRTPQRLMQTAVSWNTEVLSGVPPTSARVTLQPQETVGLSLVERKKDVKKSVPPSGSGDHLFDLFEEDLTVGIRPDIQALYPDQDPAGARLAPYTSLTARRIRRVRLNGRDVTDMFERLLGMVDEGMIVDAVRMLKPDDAKSSHFVEGERFRWDAWVIGVPRPDADGAPRSELPEGTPEEVSNTALSGLVIEYEANPGATPQRYGHGYRIGVRHVMADGNSRALADAEQFGYQTLSLGEDDDQQGHAPFLRYEPIAPPVVLIDGLPRQNALLPERAHRAVVTSDDPDHCRRVLVPPRCASIELAIRHGMFDEQRLRESPPPGAFGRTVLTPEGDFPSFLFAFAGLRHDTEERYFRRLAGEAVPPLVPYYPDPWARRAVLAFYRASDDRLLYIDHFDFYPPGRNWPDAQELEIEVIPSITVSDPVRGFEIECDSHRRKIRLAPGIHLKLRVWHEIDVGMLNQSAVVDQIVRAAADEKAGSAIRRGLQCRDGGIEQIRAAVIERLSRWNAKRAASEEDVTVRPAFGCSSDLLNMTSFWMLNPMQELDLLHAVRVPLRPAVLSDAIKLDSSTQAVPNVARSPSKTSTIERAFKVVREPAETAVRFKGHVRLDRPTTSHVDAQAYWRDNARIGSRKAGGLKVVKVEERQALLFQLRQIAPVALDTMGTPPTSPMSVELDAYQNLQSVDDKVALAAEPGSKTPPITDPFDFGDTRSRVLQVMTISQSRHNIEFQPVANGESAADTFVRRSLPQRVIVPASKHPEPPRIDYVMPLLAWKNFADGRSTQRIREAGWFRIWLGDEWYSSGNGELLALVCWPKDVFEPLDRRFQLSRWRTTPHQFAKPDKLIERFITRWGLDPLAPQSIEFGNMPASALRNRLRHRAQLQGEGDDTLQVDRDHLQDVDTFEPVVDLSLLPDMPRMTVDDVTKAVLALYRPLFDRSSGRWFVDIQMDPQYAYKPFVRLAVARWQPHALHGKYFDLRLSRVVTSEFVQLLPARSVTITPVAAERGWREYELSITGTMLDRRSGGKSEWAVGIDEQYPERRGSAWVPLAIERDVKGSLVQGVSTPVYADDVVVARARVPDRLGAQYSVVLEELESLAGACAPSEGRLVFFDRIVLGR